MNTVAPLGFRGCNEMSTMTYEQGIMYKCTTLPEKINYPVLGAAPFSSRLGARNP